MSPHCPTLTRSVFVGPLPPPSQIPFHGGDFVTTSKRHSGRSSFFLLFYCISGAPLFIQRMARAWRYYGTSDCRRSSSRVKKKRHGEYGHTSVWLCGRVRLCLSPRLLVRFLPLLHSSPSSCIPPHSLSLFPFFFCCRLPDGKATGKKKSVLWGAKARTYTLLFSSRSFFGLRHDDSYHNYTLSRQQSSVLRENKQTKKKVVCACVFGCVRVHVDLFLVSIVPLLPRFLLSSYFFFCLLFPCTPQPQVAL